jgi:hypothetical protein
MAEFISPMHFVTLIARTERFASVKKSIAPKRPVGDKGGWSIFAHATTVVSLINPLSCDASKRRK